MNRSYAVGVFVLSLAVATSAGGVTVAGGGSKRTDCLVQLQASGLGFPGGKPRFKGATCADGDPCDADGARNGSCLYRPMICLNQTDPALPNCTPAVVRTISFKGKNKKKKIDTSGFDAAVASLLPASTAACAAPVDVIVPLVGPNKKGEVKNGEVGSPGTELEFAL